MALPQAAARPGIAAGEAARRGCHDLLHPTHYERLGLPEDALAHAIEQAWQARCAALPSTAPGQPSLALPGVPDSPALQAAALRLAHAVLSDPARRAVYDDWLARERGRTAALQRRARWWRRPAAKLAVIAALLVGAAALAWWGSR